MNKLKTYLDNRNTPALTLFVFVLVASAAVGLLAWMGNEAIMPHAELFGALCSWMSLAVGTIWLSRTKT